MKKFSFLLCAAALALATTFTSCSNEDNSVYPDDIVIRNGYDLNDIIAQKAEITTGDEVVVELPAQVTLIADTIKSPDGKKLTLISDPGAPATIMLNGYKGFFVENDLVLENIIIDASKQKETDPWNNTIRPSVIELTWDPTSEANEANYRIIDQIALKNVQVKGVKNRLIFDNYMPYAIKNLIIEGSEVEFVTEYNDYSIDAALEFWGGGVFNLDIENSKFVQEGNYNFRNFSAYQGEAIPDNVGLANETWSFIYKNNTFDKISGSYWHEGGDYYKVDRLSIDIQGNTWNECQTWSGEQNILETLRRWHPAEDLASVNVSGNAFVKTENTYYNFYWQQYVIANNGEANPSNVNGNQNNGQGFYGWESATKTDSKRNDYKGYQNSNILPNDGNIWIRTDRFSNDNFWANEGGITPTADRHLAIAGLEEGSKVRINLWWSTNAADNILWAIGDGSSDETLGGPRATATIDGVEAVTGQTTIPSGAEIVVKSVTPAVNGTGYIVIKVKKGTIIQSIEVSTTRTTEE